MWRTTAISPPQTSLEDLLARVALGDKIAFDAIYERTCAKLFGVCLRILNDREDAEDAVHECYINVWRRAEQYARSKASPIAWMCAIARNASIDRLRKRRESTTDLDEAFELADDRPSPQDAAVFASNQRALMACLEELEDPKATAVRTAFLSGHTYAELAEAMGTPLGTVKSWIHRGLQQLKACLER